MGRILAIDLGEERIGLAISDPTGTIASALPTLGRGAMGEEIPALQETIAREDVERVIVGLPLRMDGSDSAQTTLTRRWAKSVEQAVSVPVELVDERLTTVQAHHTLDALGVGRRKQRGRVDALAATLLLQGYMEQRRAVAGASQPADASADAAHTEHEAPSAAPPRRS